VPYIRLTNPSPLSPEERAALLEEYLEFYDRVGKEAAENSDYSALNVKLPRLAAASFLERVGALLLEAASEAAKDGEVRHFLDKHPLPPALEGRLPDDYRAYSLLLNALKQWVSAESAATDRYLLGGTVRTRIREARMGGVCPITGEIFSKIELHHPMRDGRPPIPLSHKGHALIEQTTKQDSDDPVFSKLQELRRAGNRSWIALRRGCESHLGETVSDRTQNSLNSARSFANRALELTGLSFEDLIAFLDDNELGQ